MSEFDPQRPSVLFHHHVQAAVQEAVLRCVFNGYRATHEYAFGMLRAPEAHDLCNLSRWKVIDGHLRELAPRFGLIGMTNGNSTSSSSHTLVVAGRVRITQHKVDSPDALVRDAEYRRGYAAECQGRLFEDAPPAPSDNDLYAVVLHGPDAKNRLPAFVVVRFPASNCEAYVGKAIDLCSRFPHVIDEYKDRTWAVERIDEPDATLREEVRRPTADEQPSHKA